jgi:hypothetical protein
VQRVAAIATGLAWLAQVIGLQLVCLCGSCSLSHAWGIAAAPVHACCHAAQEPEVDAASVADCVSRAGCACAGHAVQAFDADLSRDDARADSPAWADLSPPQGIAVLVQRVVDVPVVRARGPPIDAGPPRYLRHASLLI